MKIWTNTDILDSLIQDLELTENSTQADIIILGSKTVNLDDFPQLKGIFRVGVGIDNVPVYQAKKRNIKVQITSRETNEYIFEETANFTCFMVLRMAFNNVGDIDPWNVKFRCALKDQRLLVIGKGNIGQRVADRMSSFLPVETFDILYNDQEHLKNFISRADYIVLSIPLTSENQNLFDKEKLSWMKDGATLINTARGHLVSEDALYGEIMTGRIKAAFDVFWTKPYTGKLREFFPERFFMTPHVSSKCEGYLTGAADDLHRFIKEIADD